MQRSIFAVAVALIFGSLAAARGQEPVGTSGTGQTAGAVATLADAQGRNVGTAQLRQTPHGVLLKLDLKNATPGVHGLHIHEAGQCEGPDFKSAGGHFNPAGRQHGFLNPNGPHAGDLPNIEVPSTTAHSVEYLIPGVTLDPGPQSLLGKNGSAIVIHAKPDDYMTDPAGEAGDRLVCGAIVSAAQKGNQE